MKRTPTTIFLALAVAFQLTALTGMVVLAHLPLWTGTQIRVKTQPVDPRSLFRGNYVNLYYAFGAVPQNALADTGRLRKGQIVYVTLEENESEFHVFSAVALEPPSGKIFLRGRVRSHSTRNAEQRYIIRFGIEAYFVPKHKARKLEKELREGGVATLMVTERGKAALKAVAAGIEVQ